MDALHYCELTVGRWPFRRSQGFSFDMLAWYLLYDEFGWDFDKIAATDRVEVMSKMVYCAAKSANYSKGKSARFTIKDVGKWMENTRTKESDRMRAVFERSMRVLPSMMADRAAKYNAAGGEKKTRSGTK